MAIVKLHEASDGSLHKTFKEFADHEAALKIIAGVSSADLDVSAFDASELVDDNGRPLTYTADLSQIAAFIVGNADLLRKVLSDAKIAQRGRKPAGRKPRKPKLQAVSSDVPKTSAEAA